MANVNVSEDDSEVGRFNIVDDEFIEIFLGKIWRGENEKYN